MNVLESSFAQVTTELPERHCGNSCASLVWNIRFTLLPTMLSLTCLILLLSECGAY